VPAAIRISRGRLAFELVLVGLGVTALGVKFLLDSAQLLHLAPTTSLRLNLAAGAMAAAGVVLGVVDRVLVQQREQRTAVQRLLDLEPTRSGRLPLVRDVSPYQIGVSRSRYADQRDQRDPYVARLVDAKLDQALHESSLVLVVGASKAGKSRSAFEAVRRILPDAALLVPKADSGVLSELFGPTSPISVKNGPMVVWLDDLDRFLHPGGLDGALLSRLAERQPRVIVVGTIVALRRQRLHGTVEELGVGWQARQVLSQAVEIELPSNLTDLERASAEEAYPEESFERIGIGERLAAVELLVDKYRADEGAPRPAGWALLQAAVDWRRVGMARPIPEPLLRELSQDYLREARVNLDPTEENFQQGLAWALEPAVSHVALLERIDAGESRGYQALDYLVAVCDGQDGSPIRPIRENTWRFVFGRVPITDVLHVGFTAYTRGLRDVAQGAWQRVSQSGDQAVGQTAYELGVLLERQRDLDGAQTAYQLALDSGHPSAGPMAAANLGRVHADRGDLNGARLRYELAAAAQYAPAATLAKSLLAELPLLEPRYLLDIDESNLRELGRPPSVAHTRSAYEVRCVAWHAFELLRGPPTPKRTQQIKLIARQIGARDLANRIDTLETQRSWSIDWAHLKAMSLYRLIGRHDLWVTAVAVGELEGRPVAVSGSDDKTVRVWDLADGSSIGDPMHGHQGPVRAVAVGELEGQPVVISGSDDHTIHVWDLVSGRTLNSWRGHDGPVTAVAVGRVGDWPVVASGSSDRTVGVWELSTGRLRHTLRGHGGPVKAVAVTELDGWPVVVSGGNDRTIRVWDLASGRQLYSRRDHAKWVNCLAVGELDGRPVVVSGGEDRMVRVSQVAGDRQLIDWYDHDGPVTAVAVGKVGQLPVVASGSSDRTVRLWNLANHGLLTSLSDHDGPVTAVAMGKVGDWPVVASGNGQAVRVWTHKR
jgi:WD40 repeat protein